MIRIKQFTCLSSRIMKYVDTDFIQHNYYKPRLGVVHLLSLFFEDKIVRRILKYVYVPYKLDIIKQNIEYYLYQTNIEMSWYTWRMKHPETRIVPYHPIEQNRRKILHSVKLYYNTFYMTNEQHGDI